MPSPSHSSAAPRRSLFRPRNIVLVIALGLAIALGAGIYHIATLTPGKPGKFNADLVKLIEDSQSDSQGQPNSWDLFISTTELYAALAKPMVARAKPADWGETLAWPPAPEEAGAPNAGPKELAEYRAVLKYYQDSPLYARLDELALARRFVRPIPEGKLIDLLIPSLGQSRGIARLSKARMYFAAQDGDGPEFVRAATHALALAQVCKKQSTLIEHLVGGAIDSLVASSIREAARDHKLSPQTCRELLTLLNARVTKVDVIRGLKGEHIFARDVIEWTHTDDGNGDGLIIPSLMMTLSDFSGQPGAGPSIPPALTNFGTLVLPGKKQSLDVFDEFYTIAQNYAATPLRDREKAQSPDTFVNTVSSRYTMVKLMAPALGRYIQIADKCDLEIASAKLMLALELHQAAHAEYPATLKELDPPLASLNLQKIWLNEIVYKPFKPGEDPLPPGTRPYTLYWIGLDRMDNKGHFDPKAKGDPAWDGNSKGFDLLLNPPKPLPEPKQADETK